MDMELESLLKGTETNFERRTVIGYLKENATVDILQQYCSIFLHRSTLANDFQDYLEQCKHLLCSATQSSDVIISNYFARKGIVRTQICTLTINRYIIDVGGFTERRPQYAKDVQETQYQGTIAALKSSQIFSLW